MEFVNQMILLAGLLFVVSILATVITPRLGVPLLLVFLVIGMLAGENGPGGIVFNDYRLANLAGTAALAVILFDGGMRTRLQSFRVALAPSVTLASLGVLLTCLVTGLAAGWILDLHWTEGLLIGAIVGSTDAAAVFSLLHTSAVSLNQRVSATLEIESGTNDPAAVFLTLALIQYLLAPSQFGLLDSLLFFLWQMGGGVILGLGGGWLAIQALNRLALAESLYPLLALFSGLLIFGATANLNASGFLAVYIAGLVLGNQPVHGFSSIRRFHDGIAWMAQIGMFVILGLLVTPVQLAPLLLPGLLIAGALMLCARPLAVFLCLLPFRFPWREQLFIAWVGLRGSVPILLATYPLMAGLEHALLYFNVAFFIVLMSLVIQGWSIAPAARLLGLQVPDIELRVHRSDFDLPGQQGYEIVSYRVAPRSALVNRPTKGLPMPENTRIVCVVRNGRLLSRDWGVLQAGDYVSLLADKHSLPALDQLFQAEALPARERERRFFGEFMISPEASLAELAQTYGLELPPGSEGETVAQFIQRTLPRPVVGDRVTLGDLQLIIKAMEDGRVIAVGLRFNVESD
jgi:cell volume regulation protein A